MQDIGMQLFFSMKRMFISKLGLPRIFDEIVLFLVSLRGALAHIAANQHLPATVFLRALDYFQGILFLTTNRVGSFDEAIMSRIHVQIGYDPLDEDSRRQIWDGYFKKLSKNHNNDGQEIRCSYDAKEFVRKSDDLRALRWNGREIRNGK